MLERFGAWMLLLATSCVLVPLSFVGIVCLMFGGIEFAMLPSWGALGRTLAGFLALMISGGIAWFVHEYVWERVFPAE